MTHTDAKDETPRTDALMDIEPAGTKPPLPKLWGDQVDKLYELCRTLERELLAAQTENERLARERDEWKRCVQVVFDESGVECRPTCDSLAHAEDCPIISVMNAMADLRSRLTTAEAALSAERADHQLTLDTFRKQEAIWNEKLAVEIAAREAAQRDAIRAMWAAVHIYGGTMRIPPAMLMRAGGVLERREEIETGAIIYTAHTGPRLA